MSRSVLVTGGAGYVGSHVVLALRDQGERVVVLDDLRSGHVEAVPPDVQFVSGRVQDLALVARLVIEHQVDTVMHLAASTVVPESVRCPGSYFENNTHATASLMECCAEHGVQNVVLSSTAAVYGAPGVAAVSEMAVPQPANPYGASKLAAEWAAQAIASAWRQRIVTLRYFNVAGADKEGRAGQRKRDSTLLLDAAVQAALGRRECVEVFGDDYPTPDGTCIRDYVHPTDVAAAHVAALDHLRHGGPSVTLNVGYGKGYSVLDVLRAVEQATGCSLSVRAAPRRAGDPPAVVARADELPRALGWRPAMDDLGVMVRTAIDFERRMGAA